MSDDYLLWPGQTWQVQINGDTKIAEIMDIAPNDNIRVRLWHLTDGSLTKYIMGNEEQVNRVTLFAGRQQGHRIDIIKTGKTSGTGANVRLTPVPHSYIMGTQETPQWVEQALQWVATAPPGFTPCIHTDGSYNEANSPIEAIFSDAHKRIQASAGLVIMHNGPDWRDYPQLVLHLQNGSGIDAKSAYTMEYLALAAALRLQEHGLSAAPVSSDAKAVIRTINNRHHHLLNPDCTHRVVLQSIDRSLRSGAIMPVWTRGHPEKREPDTTKWTLNECGNHLADRAAGNNRGQFRTFTRIPTQTYEPTWITVNCSDIIQDCVREGDVYWGDSAGRPSCLNGLMDTVYRTRLHTYSEHRDMTRDGPQKWLDGTP